MNFVLENSETIEEDTVRQAIAKHYDRTTAAKVWTRLTSPSSRATEPSESPIAHFPGQLAPLLLTYDGPQGEGVFDVFNSEIHFVESAPPNRRLILEWEHVEHYDKSRDGTLSLRVVGLLANPWWPADQEHLLISRNLQLRPGRSSDA